MSPQRSHDLLNPEGLRIDGRRPNELRRIECKLGVHSGADGSAFVQMGQTQVLCLVYGPHEQKGSKSAEQLTINVDYRIAPFASTDRKYRSKNDKRLQEMAIYVKRALEQVVITNLYPRSSVDIQLQVLQSDGGSLHSCINAASLALVDAGVPMYDYLCSCSAGFIETSAVLDLSQMEESSSFDIPKFTVAVMPASGRVVMLHLESKMPVDKFDLVRNMAVDGARQIRAVLDTAIRRSLQSSVANRLLMKPDQQQADDEMDI